MTEIGNLETLLFKVGNYVEGSRDLRTVEIWAQGQLLTPVDTSAYLPSYVHALKKDLLWVDDEKSVFSERFLNYGETTDDFNASATKQGDIVCIKFNGSEQRLPPISINKPELAATLNSVIEILAGHYA